MSIVDAANIDITFSYPKSDIDTPNGYFEWRDSINAKYNKYIVSNFYFDINKHKLVVNHKNSTGNLYSIFDTVNTTNSDSKLTNLKIIHLNHIIGNNLLNIPVLNTNTNLKYDSNFYSGYDIANKYVYFNKTKLSFDETNADDNITDIPSDVSNAIIKAVTQAGSSVNLNTFRKGMFINDEMECGESTVGSAESSVTGTGQIKPLSNSQAEYTYYGVALIMSGLLLQYAILVVFEKVSLTYPLDTKLLTFCPQDYNVRCALYLIFTVIAFIASVAFFLLYGIFGPSTKNPSSSYWYYLALAIFYLLAFISYLWWKVTYLTHA